MVLDHLAVSRAIAGFSMSKSQGQAPTKQRHQASDTTPADPDAALRQWLRDYAKKHPRWGFRRAYHDARG
jgi:hypothetical protein